jgi:tripartite-type tricarboxylate transporter receptor subunit TctC
VARSVHVSGSGGGHVRAGDLRAIGFTGDEPYPDHPDALVLSAGYRISGAWAGLLAPAGTPAETVAFLHREIKQAANAPCLALCIYHR